MSLLEQDITKKSWVDKTTSQIEFENNNNSEEYEVKIIYNNEVYANKLEDYLLGFYYLVFWKNYL